MTLQDLLHTPSESSLDGSTPSLANRFALLRGRLWQASLIQAEQFAYDVSGLPMALAPLAPEEAAAYLHALYRRHFWRLPTGPIKAIAAAALALVALSSLSYLGLGTPPGEPEWGRMLSENQSLLFQNPAGVLAPALAIVFFATSVTIIGDWIYDRFSYSGRTGR